MVRDKGKLPANIFGVKYTRQPAHEHSSSDEGINPYMAAQDEKKRTMNKSRRDDPVHPTLLRLLKTAMTRASIASISAWL